jgi:hypothetical protein
MVPLALAADAASITPARQHYPDHAASSASIAARSAMGNILEKSPAPNLGV